MVTPPPSSHASPTLLTSLAPSPNIVGLGRYRSAELTIWRQRANDQRGAVSRAGLAARWPASYRDDAIHLYILLLASCPDVVDVQVIALAVQYLDRYLCCSSSSSSSSSSSDHRHHHHHHIAAACIALAIRWESCDAGFDLVGQPRDPPEQFNRLIEVFSSSSSGGDLTPALLGRIQSSIAAQLDYSLWFCTPAEWLVMVRNTGPVAFVTAASPAAEMYPPMCWLRREPTPKGGDRLPTRAETAAALARLPLEERLLLRALRQPELVEWSPCRIATACLALAVVVRRGEEEEEAVTGTAAAPLLPTLGELEAARLATTPNGDGDDAGADNVYDDARILRLAHRHQATDRDANHLKALLLLLLPVNATDATTAATATSAALLERIPTDDLALLLTPPSTVASKIKIRATTVTPSPPCRA